MLHLVFSKEGLYEIKHHIKRHDLIVHISSDSITLYKAEKLVRSIEAEARGSTKNSYIKALNEGQVIQVSDLAAIVANAPSIKSTY